MLRGKTNLTLRNWVRIAMALEMDVVLDLAPKASAQAHELAGTRQPEAVAETPPAENGARVHP